MNEDFMTNIRLREAISALHHIYLNVSARGVCTQWPIKTAQLRVLNVFPKCVSKNDFFYLFMNYHLIEVIILS